MKAILIPQDIMDLLLDEEKQKLYSKNHSCLTEQEIIMLFYLLGREEGDSIQYFDDKAIDALMDKGWIFLCQGNIVLDYNAMRGK